MEKHRDWPARSGQIAVGVALFMALAWFDSGCAFNRRTEPPRSATEQLLLSTVADRALQSSNFVLFAHRKVFVETNYFDSYDSGYVLGTVRDALSRAGALLMENESNSDIAVEIRSGALSADSSDSLIGIPSTGLPIPLVGAIPIPELALYKSEDESAYGKIAVLAYATKSREHIYSSGPLVGKSYNNYHKILFISWITTDIPEKKSNPEKGKKYETWFPQYDPANLPPPGPSG